MPAIVYDTIRFAIPAGMLTAEVAKSVVFEGVTEPKGWVMPTLKRHKLAVGVGLGEFNVVSKFYHLSDLGPTDYDLTNLLDPLGNPVDLNIVKYFVVLNWATTAGHALKMDGTVADAWLEPFDGIATAKLKIPPGWTDGTTVTPGILLLGGGSLAGMAVSPTSKILSIDAGFNTIGHSFFAVGVDS